MLNTVTTPTPIPLANASPKATVLGMEMRPILANECHAFSTDADRDGYFPQASVQRHDRRSCLGYVGPAQGEFKARPLLLGGDSLVVD